LTEGPIAQIVISVTATVLTQFTYTPDDASSWITLVTTTANDGIELDPRGVYFRWIWTANTGTLAISVGPGQAADGLLANVKGVARKSTPPA
jgi:hypothetical protein